ncbi:phosphonate C-P lyase system protein PhnH [uncultured Litoreibacter sp.]|uniref:phosphonate C-P lyase system protein PhnH n=1 Tax=uncultured Litoreibacter sp. TaxID=1392394 RepID=UPI00262259EA|nr:phosphonate C-P lyase system protein PhnH [uncultured Litoreibacter sp.]
MQAQTLSGGFADTATASAVAFRQVMEAMARPGTIHMVTGAAPPAPLSPATGVVLLTLCDPDTPVHLSGALDCDAVRTWIAFHTGAPVVGPSHCVFAVGGWDDLTPLSAYQIGTPQYPDRSATLIVQVDQLEPNGAILSGPGIKDTHSLSLPETRAFQLNAGHFPFGLDFIFTCGDRVAALPRTTVVMHKGAV